MLSLFFPFLIRMEICSILDTFLGKKKLVIFFYPQDGSLNCTREACYFRDLSDVFDEAGAVVVGISGQSVESHKQFAEQNKLNYTILSDSEGSVRKLFGVPTKIFGLVPGTSDLCCRQIRESSLYL